MPMFENAHDFSIYGGTFIDQGGDDPMKPLVDRVVWAAMQDSDERYDPPRCHPKTRKSILTRLDQWATGPSECPILWLNGPAGAGKSAIAQTMAERWSRKGILGASFFMQRTAAGRNNKENLLSTLAYQFAVHNPRLSAHVKSVMTSDPQILERSLATQLQKIIVDGLAIPETEDSETRGTLKVIIIDGLDECCTSYKTQSPEEQQKQILEAIASVSERSVALRFLIASRPECQIRYCFSHGSLLELTEQISLQG